MEQNIKDYAIGYYNDDRVDVIRRLETGDKWSRMKAVGFMLDYQMLLPGMYQRWSDRLRDDPSEETRTALARELRDANPVNMTDEQALHLMARNCLELLERRAYNDTEKTLLQGMIQRDYPEVAEKMNELWTERESYRISQGAGQAPSD